MRDAKNAFAAGELTAPGLPATYAGASLNQVAFPLGGIGTGCVSLSGRGALVDWEIFNRPNKCGAVMPYSFFAIWACARGGEPVTRVLQSPPQPPFTGQGRQGYSGLGFGVGREDGSGLPHMRSAVFRGEFPLAEIQFSDPRLPVEVRLEAYSPFIPMNADDSGLPIAVLRYHVTNPGPESVDVSVAGSLFNAVGYPGSGPFVGPHLGRNSNHYQERGSVRGLFLTSDKYDPGAPQFGNMGISTTWGSLGTGDLFYQEASLRGAWFDAMHDYWDHFSATGTLPLRSYPPSDEGKSDVATLGLRATLAPGETVTLPFFVTWYFPNFVKYWDAHRMDGAACCEGERTPPGWRNYYASQWADALEVASYYAANEERLYGQTRLFHDTLFASKLPPFVLDAVSSQASILHSPTVLRLSDGTFYGFEGCHCDAGCCEGTCTHVWNYAQTLAFLFPALERSVREADYTYNLREDGSMGFRLQLPLGSAVWHFLPAADGQLGGLMKLYRDWRLSGDDEWLRKWWPKAKRALEYAWKEWDADRDGVIEGIQHNTYDVEFSGPNSFIGCFYLGALRAGEEIATHLGDEQSARTYRRIFESGRSRIESELWNGAWYVQKPDWDRTPKYQYGEGCLADQVLGQWLAELIGLGELLDCDHVRVALQSIFRHNWRPELWEHANPQRIYALNDEQGLLLCTWPNGGRPAIPFPYSDEVWPGIEYQVASHLIYQGFVEEGLTIVKGLRARHDGVRRNPWNEFECGSHYARSLASWGLLTALSGFQFDMPRKTLGFNPRLYPEECRYFWSVDGAWGLFEQQRMENGWDVRLSVTAGELCLEQLLLAAPVSGSIRSSQVGERNLLAEAAGEGGQCVVRLPEGTRIGAGQSLHIMLSP